MAAANSNVGIEDHQLPEDTHNTYAVRFYDEYIHTTLTHDAGIVADWIAETEQIHQRRLNKLIIGLDVEWRPSFNRHVQYRVATIQLCVGHRCLIFQIIHCPVIPDALVDFFRNPNYNFVGVGIENDLDKLEEDYELGLSARWVDLRTIAADVYGRNELKSAGLKTLASVVLERDLKKPKHLTMSRWDNQWLTPPQVQYACLDAFICFEIGRILNQQSNFALR